MCSEADAVMEDYADYANQRKAYISEVRSSFEQGDAESGAGRQVRETTGGRLRLLVSLILFLLFFVWYDSETTIQGMAPEKVIDLIEDNRYDTILQEVLSAGETAVMGQR